MRSGKATKAKPRAVEAEPEPVTATATAPGTIRIKTPELEFVPLSDLAEVEDNPQRHDVELLKRSIVTYGFVGAILLSRDGDRIIDGHGRKTALEELIAEGWSLPGELVPVLRGDFTPKEARELLLVTDKSRGFFDPKLELAYLERTMRELGSTLDDLRGMGYRDSELRPLGALGKQEETPPEEFPVADEDIHVDYECPRCGYGWSGQPRPKRDDE